MNTSPTELTFTHNEYGKPSLNACRGNRLCFNVSHSAERVLYAVAYGREVGVDIEYIRPFENAEEIVERFFSEQEKVEFRNLPSQLKNNTFFIWWTRKEAYAKAIGLGMSVPFDNFSVSSISDEPFTPIRCEDATRWIIKDVKVDSKYVAAVAAEGSKMNLYFWRWV
ncbi:4'-phosphopantetheinyl transferase superfamily protein [Candidatus Desantisbacteria bacterium]|nr:4'-phosphopantetheinyl transferase superfamily protein [Candidatus Desantisbacteria bacterium]